VGRALAQRWIGFVDLDTHIETRERQTIAEIFSAPAQLGFRAAEASVSASMTESLPARTIARAIPWLLWAAEPSRMPNLELLRPWPTVFLDAPVDDLWQRTLWRTRRSARYEEMHRIARLHHERLPFYRQARVLS